MLLEKQATTVTRTLVGVHVVNRLAAFGMGFLGVRLARDLGADLDLIGWVLAAFGACTIPSRILGGLLANRFGTRAAMLIGLVACAAAHLVIALGDTVTVVVAGALLLGLAYEVIEPASQALVAQAVPPGRRAASYSLLWAATSVAAVASGALAAFLTRWGVSALFLADAVTSLAAAAVVALRLPATPGGLPAARWRGAISARLLGWTAIGSGYATLTMIVVFMLPLAVEASGRPPALTGWLLATSAAAAIAAQRLVRSAAGIPPATTLAIGYAVLAAGVGLWAWATPPALLAGAALLGTSGALLLGTQQAIASTMARPGAEATVMTVYGLSWGVGTVTAPLLGASLLQHGPGTLWLTCAASAAVLALGHGTAAIAAGVVGRPHRR